MTVNHKVTGTASSMVAGLMAAWAAGMMVTIIAATISGFLIAKEILMESSVGYCVMALVTLSSAVSAIVAVYKIKRRRLIVCVLAGMIYYGSLVAMTALFFGGQYHGMGVIALLVAAGCGSVVLLELKGEGSGHRRKYSRPHR